MNKEFLNEQRIFFILLPTGFSSTLSARPTSFSPLIHPPSDCDILHLNGLLLHSSLRQTNGEEREKRHFRQRFRWETVEYQSTTH